MANHFKIALFFLIQAALFIFPQPQQQNLLSFSSTVIKSRAVINLNLYSAVEKMVFLLRITCKAPLFFNILVLLCNLIFIQCTDVSNKKKIYTFCFQFFFLFCVEMFHQLFNYLEIKISIILANFFCKGSKLKSFKATSCNY